MLNITLRIDHANKKNIPRIAQLTQKTNQFNLTTRRYTIEEIERGINLLAGLDKKVKTRNIIDESEFTNLITQIYRYE